MLIASCSIPFLYLKIFITITFKYILKYIRMHICQEKDSVRDRLRSEETKGGKESKSDKEKMTTRTSDVPNWEQDEQGQEGAE